MTAREALAAMKMIVGIHPGYEPESLRLQPAMVNVHSLQVWAAAIEKEMPTEAERKFMEAAMAVCQNWEAGGSGTPPIAAMFAAYSAVLAERAAKEAV